MKAIKVGSKQDLAQRAQRDVIKQARFDTLSTTIYDLLRDGSTNIYKRRDTAYRIICNAMIRDYWTAEEAHELVRMTEEFVNNEIET